MNAERQRLEENRRKQRPWDKWGPYLSERQWGTVREDYSPHGTAWEYFPHDMARSRAYRWGEDGLAGICDRGQRLCLALALWNGKDAILKERLFGLTGAEGNHGEDVKELYYYLDATPTYSYLKMLYKYPATRFPYRRLVAENRRRGRHQAEFEITDSGVFDDNRYFDVFVEYAKADAEDLLMRITVHNRGPETAEIHLLPQAWFRNTWAWDDPPRRDKPVATLGRRGVELEHPQLGRFQLDADGQPAWLFCENETNPARLFGIRDAKGFFKDAFHKYVIRGRKDAVNPARTGTKVAAHYRIELPAASSHRLRLRLSKGDHVASFRGFDNIFETRHREADAFYNNLQHGIADGDARSVQRQALSGLLWSKQFYNYDVAKWLRGDPTQPQPPAERRTGRNHEWFHLYNAEVLSMPDKWEYPWYAAWDLAFHCIPLALVDAEFAKQQLVLLTREWYMHPNGQLPAYEWAFGDVNPPVHAWAAWRVYKIDRKQTGRADRPFLERVFHKLLLNFTWWVNRKDAGGNNVFQGGFLGLDNIGVFDRSEQLAGGGHLDQADGTSWMAMFCLNMLRIALELALENPVYEDIASKFFEHFLYIAAAMNNLGGRGVCLWDEQDEFCYDVVHLPNGRMMPLRIRSMVGLIPLFAVETIEPEILDQLPNFARRLHWFFENRPDLAGLVSHWEEPGRGSRRLLSLLRGHRMKCLLRRMLDEQEFLSEFGVRSLSKYHRQHPYVVDCNDGFLACEGDPQSVSYEPAESGTAMFGGNSNWRGPIWFPVNYLLIESLQKFHHYYGDDFKIECPTGSGTHLTINDVARDLSRRLSRIFLKDDDGRRPVFGHPASLHDHRHFRDHLLFYEYFHGDNGRGVGASHQTGWTALVAKLLHPKREPVH